MIDYEVEQPAPRKLTKDQVASREREKLRREQNRLTSRARIKREMKEREFLARQFTSLDERLAAEQAQPEALADECAVTCRPLLTRRRAIEARQRQDVERGVALDEEIANEHRAISDQINTANLKREDAVAESKKRLAVLVQERQTLAEAMSRLADSNDLFRMGQPALTRAHKGLELACEWISRMARDDARFPSEPMRNGFGMASSHLTREMEKLYEQIVAE